MLNETDGLRGGGQLPPAMIDALPGIGTGVPQQTPSVQTTRHVTIVANGHSASSRPAASSSSSRRADAERAESSTPAPKVRTVLTP